MLRYFKILVNSILLLTMTSVALYPQGHIPQITFQTQKVNFEEKQIAKDYMPSYDEILRLLDELESGELENKCSSEQQLENLTHFVALLAKEGVLPDNSPESLSLDDDIEELLNGEDNLYEDALSFVSPGEYRYMIIPAVLYGNGEAVLCKSWVKKQWKHVKKFAKKHKKALIIGAAVVVAAAVVVITVAAVGAGAAAAGAAGAVAATPNSNKPDKKEESSSSSSISSNISPGTAVTQEASALRSALNDQAYCFKENIAQNQFFQPTNPEIHNQSLSWEENARVLGSLFAHDSYNNLQNQIPYDSRLAQEIEDINSKYSFSIPGGYQDPSIGHPEIDRKFSTDYTPLYSNPNQEVDFNSLSHQLRGEKALAFGYYDQAIQDLGKAIDTNPTNPVPYLERGIAYFESQQYDRSLEDYKQFTAQSQAQKLDSLSISEFSLGVAKGLPKGVFDSGKVFFLFMTDFVKHPIQTSRQIVDSVITLTRFVRDDEWGVVAEVLSPEMHQLVTQWDTLSSEKRGELAGYTVGKHGADILVPGALVKVANKSLKSAQELAAICKTLQKAQETLVLETASEIGNSAKIAEIVRNGQTMVFLGEELGFTAQEIGQLKQTEKLGGAINSGLEKLVSQSESEVYKAAIFQNKHVKMVRDYLDKPSKEIQKGVTSYERQIALHKDKIANPAKHCPDWDKLDPRQREALLNKKWPTEIQVYEEQRSILQSILNERISHE